MNIKREYFPSGDFAGLSIFWRHYRYKTYVHIEHGWKGHYPKGISRLHKLNSGSPWWHGGSLMLIDRRICWKTILWITGPESYTVTRGEIADNLYEVESHDRQ